MDYAKHIAGDKAAILPSLLAADFGNLEAGVRKAEAAGADGLHLDIMDGHFVPNLTMGPDVVRMAQRCCPTFPRSVHLMMSNPGDHIEKFIKAGADVLLIHVEIDGDVPALLREIRRLGARPGITLNPGTPAAQALPYLALADEVLCMTVHPGYGGQKFMAEMMPKVRELRRQITEARLRVDISVDGGIDLETVSVAAAAGANVFIAGTSLYAAADMPGAVTLMRSRAGSAYSKRNE